MLPQFDYIRPGSLDEAVARGAGDGAVLHSGGTDLLGCLRDGVFTADTVVAIGHLAELRGIEETRDGGLRIGALSTLSEIAAHPLIAERYTVLSLGAGSAASPQLRNQGTIGGNICQRPRCWYFRGDFHCLRKGGSMCYAVAGANQYHCIFGGDRCYIVHPSDTAPALVALGARARIIGPSGTRVVPLESFFVLPAQNVRRETILEPGELVAEVLLPPPGVGLRSTYRKVRARGAWDFALAGAAAALTFSDGRVNGGRLVLSGVAPIPWRAAEAERVLIDNPLDAETIRRAVEACVADARPMPHNGYKVDLVRGVVAETLRSLA
ncbi:MAG: xanthine dehydrogenase family protein subunit M [Gemmatimonadetes bacterium]|uniref:Xanthine dehydrogenase family protein subunit M n=1 Tax=Candidatus Kutchimonas denitrificans TaxID=3056748 RepID=A0AAE5CD64_9BACT|nr:xanthine dehydrogenase family protein subunit M [Gemmatimonadota bacterium]NIR76680.1 xanthine dehydrogenase family protein subunit M [Candidatus Kutchimonas denitrificans]NIS01167.1 xanthine dehydrogenase family protein subunit M [Gemmatimonadota bacterium]NIT68206.1 xanthine dehydrogenase family protein subunit M [Gemmatimonadota bacterium]NIW75424.1 xanthine dehydrogenase family protein subunit M [Gemmatimonadota bacterium]